MIGFIRKTIDQLFKKDTPKYEIWEGVSGCWHYHISTGGRKGVQCGDENVMSTDLPLDSWGFKSDHLHETYCKECEIAYKEILWLKM